MRDIQVETAADGRVQELLEAAAEFFETHLWESKGSRNAQLTLDREELGEDVVRSFGVGYAPVDPDDLLDHLRGLGYSDDELVEAGLATRSVRGRVHARFYSRVMFPVREPSGRVVGFAGLGTHVGPSWSLWVTSPDVGLYRRSEAVFALDRAAPAIAKSGSALVERDCVGVLRAHQDGGPNAVTVHSSRVTREQLTALGGAFPGGAEKLELELPPGMKAESLEASHEEAPAPPRPAAKPAKPEDRFLETKKTAIVIATGLAAVNLCTGAPLAALWIGSQVQGGQVLSLTGVLSVLVVMGVLAFLLARALTWLHAKYDELTGRPPVVGRTSPWGRRMQGELNEHFRAVYGLSPPERVVAAVVIAAVVAFEIWLIFFAGSSIG
jgi:DNA primase catalytic core, N-terminal domain